MRPARDLALPALLLCASCGCSQEPVREPFEACGPEVTEVEEHDWIVTSLRWGGESEGFDLDDEDTQCDNGCVPDGDGGVDSRFAFIADSLDDIHEMFSLGPCTSFLCDPQSTLDDGRLTMLLKIREGTTVEEVACLEAAYHNGIDADGDPSDNSSGNEELEAARSSMLEGGTDLFHDARFTFTSGGELVSVRRWLQSDDAIEIVIGPPDGERATLRIQNVLLWMDQRSSTSRGMLVGYIPVKDMSVFMQSMAAEMGDIDPESAMNIIVNQADGDIIPSGSTDDACSSDGDCPLPWQDCGGDGYCIEPDNRRDAISATLVFEAVPCEITGIAEE